MTKTFAAEATTMCAAFQATIARRRPDAVAIRTVGGATTLTFREWGERVRELAGALSALGVGHGDRVALMMANRPEFYPIDVAVQHLGGTPFSIYNTSAVEQINYLLSDSGARVVLCESQFADRLLAAIPGTAVEHVVCIDAELAGTISLDAAIAMTDPAFDFTAAWQAVRPDDVLTLIYTSGTTGNPKGVQLTHANVLALIDAFDELLRIDHNGRIVSYLPSAHIADRWTALYTIEVYGNQITTVADRKDFAAALADTHPTVFGGVPQVWQKLKAAVEAKLGEATGIKAAPAKWAVEVGRETSDARLDGKSTGLALRLQHQLADRLVLAKLRSALGLDGLTLAVSAAAPISPDVLRYFNGLGIPVGDTWGMSELSGVVTLNTPDNLRPGTVGRPVRGCELRIAEDGEILARGPFVMKGYLNQPEKTAETIDADGWVATGDVGAIDADGYLTIVDRKKELIINAAGKNMSPGNIESWIKAFSPLIGQAIAIGDNRKYNVALIALDPDAAAIYAEKTGVAADPATLAKDPGIRAAVEAAVELANAKLSRVEQIKKFAIVPDFWEPGSDVLTPTMKLRRKPINANYAEMIEHLYA
ncbi:long-chain fatty acid--CoA ligase [Nocardia sp. XZ_19_385]|uniref:AMP-dependent synthetase/ligase n=1 Tax=Nocardia sp. XZ_19_385 TaxID=2769488 RepID=UPI00188F4E3A|nr:long-chain fatty acid--CoA ligase [Nocardia sp. XZ_19_385]